MTVFTLAAFARYLPFTIGLAVLHAALSYQLDLYADLVAQLTGAL